MNDVKSIRFPPPVADEMVRAIQANRKTVTRRVVKPQPTWSMAKAAGEFKFFGYVREIGPEPHIYKPPYHLGDILYVRETWNKVKRQDETEWHYEYRASCENPNYFSDGFMAEWRPSIHMPKEAARLFLRVTAVRVERLQDITEAQAKAEGATLPPEAQNDPEYAEYIGGYYNAFSELWDSTIKKSDLALYGWEENPWVWVIEFERIEKEEANG